MNKMLTEKDLIAINRQFSSGTVRNREHDGLCAKPDIPLKVLV